MRRGRIAILESYVNLPDSRKNEYNLKFYERGNRIHNAPQGENFCAIQDNVLLQITRK